MKTAKRRNKDAVNGDGAFRIEMWKRRKMTSKKRHVNHRHGAKTGKDNGATARVEVSHQHGWKGGIDSRDSLTSTGELHAQRIKNRAGSIWAMEDMAGGVRDGTLITQSIHGSPLHSFLTDLLLILLRLLRPGAMTGNILH